MKTVTIPFDLEMAKKIQSGEVEGKIVDKRKIEYEIVKWDATGDYPLIGVFFDEQLNTSYAHSFTTQGMHNVKKDSDWSLQLVVPEYLSWKEGDYLTIENYGNLFIVIFKSYDQESVIPLYYHALFDTRTSNLYTDNCFSYQDYHYITNTSTPSEIAKLTDALLKEGKKWNPETKQIEDFKNESKPEHELKPLDLIPVRCDCRELCQYAFVKDRYVHTVGGLVFNEYIPYEGNEHLLGTTNNPG